MEPFVVLGKWRMPNHYNMRYTTTWGNSGPFSIKDGWEHRPPDANADLAINTIQNGWHHDNFGDTEGLIVWSNVFPTEVKLPGGKIVSPEDNDVVLIANHLVQHRVSERYINAVGSGAGNGRHFLRASTNKYPSAKTIRAWKRALS